VVETTAKPNDFYAVGFDALVKRWDKCINVGAGYVEKCSFRIQISNVLRFIFICDLFTDSPSNVSQKMLAQECRQVAEGYAS
jgi:hypothetical protein